MTAQALQVVKAEDSLQAILEKRKTEIGKALNGTIGVDRFVRAALTAYGKTQSLRECEPASVYLALMDCAQLGLEPSSVIGDAALVPYRVRGQRLCQLIVQRSGWVKIARRAGEVADLGAGAIFEGELDERKLADGDPTLDIGSRLMMAYTPLSNPSGKVIGSFAWVKYTGDRGRGFEVLRRFEIDRVKAHALKNKSADQAKNSPWTTHEDRMAAKSALNRLIRTRLSLNDEMQRALELEEKETFDDPLTLDVDRNEAIDVDVEQAALPSETSADALARKLGGAREPGADDER